MFQIGQRVVARFDFLTGDVDGFCAKNGSLGSEMKRGKKYTAQIIGLEHEDDVEEGKSRKYLIRFQNGFEGLVDRALVKAEEAMTWEQALALPRKHRDIYFAVRADWWNEWKLEKRHSVAKESETSRATKPGGEDGRPTVDSTAAESQGTEVVDNHALEDEHCPGEISAKKIEDLDFVLLHSEVVCILRSEYGFTFSPQFQGQVVKDKFDTLVIEIHKIHVQIFTEETQQEPSTTLTFSMETRVGDVLKRVAEFMEWGVHELSVKVKEPSEEEFKVHPIPENERLGDVMDVKVIQMLVRQMVPRPENSSNHLSSLYTKRDEEGVVEDDNMEEPQCPSPSSNYSTYGSSGRSNVLSLGSGSRYSSYYGGGGSSYYSNTSGTPTARGCAGLRNLGNTCFMNSMLQCLNQIDFLTEFFLSGNYTKDINVDNVLGMEGKLAHEYANFVSSMWCNEYSTVAPFTLKKLLGEVNQAFAGYQQQDSQELMSFILDKLHEDLNRVKKKPYVEDVEGKGRPDHEVAEEAWNGFLQRNQSIVVDHLFGQLKSHITCSVCKNESVKFDPFSSLPVPLPVKSTHPIDLTYVGIKTAHPVKMSFKVEMGLSILDLKQEIAKRLLQAPEKLGIAAPKSPFHLMVVEIHACKVYQVFEDSRGVVDLRCRSDDIYCYEVQHPVSVLSEKRRHKTRTECIVTHNEEELLLHSLSADHISYNTFGSTGGYTYGGSSSYGSNNHDDDTDKEEDAKSDEDPMPQPVLLVQAVQGGKEETGYTPLVRNSYPHLFTVGLDAPTETVKLLLSEALGKYTAEAIEDEYDTEETSVSLSQNLSDENGDDRSSFSHTPSREDEQGPEDPDLPVTKQTIHAGSTVDGSRDRKCKHASQAHMSDPFVLRLAEYAGKPLTAQRKYQHYGASTNPLNKTNNDEDSKFELDNAPEGTFVDFVTNVGKEDRWSVNVGWEKGRLSQEYMSKRISLYSGDSDDDDNIDLLKCIKNLMEIETLEKGEEVYCSKCKEHRTVTKKFDLWRSPDVLIIHMKRFQYAQGAMFVRRNKLDNLVKFPVQGLDLTSVLRGPSKESHVYDLFAVSEHVGGMGGGHYTAVCQNYRDGHWYDFNDSHVTSTQAEDGVTSKAYVLFYKRRGCGVPRDQLVPEENIRDPDRESGDDSSGSNSIKQEAGLSDDLRSDDDTTKEESISYRL